MKILKRIRFVLRQYRQILPSIWESWRSGPYAAPTREQVKSFMEEGDIGFNIKINPPEIYQTCRKAPKEEVPPVRVTEVTIK
jgi:hypothetical protein